MLNKCEDQLTGVFTKRVAKWSFQVERFPSLRYVNAQRSQLTMQRFIHSRMLVHLGLARCMLRNLDQVLLPNLQSLDVSENLINHLFLTQLTMLQQLKILFVEGNPLTLSAITYHALNTSTLLLKQLNTLDLSRVSLPLLDLSFFRYFPELRVLNLSGCGVDRVVSDGIQLPSHIHTMDLRGCTMSSFPRQLLKGLTELQHVFSDNYKLCCEQTLPSIFNLKSCSAPEDNISSCDSLIRSAFLRVSVVIMALVGLCSNLAALTMQVSRWRSLKAEYGVFFSNLCVSGLMAGSYHAVLGTAGWLLEGSYLWRDTWWTHSTVCQLTAFVWMLSLQTSLLFVALVTLHSFLLLRFPAGKLGFSSLSARVACVSLWVCASLLTAVAWTAARSKSLPTSTAICVPLSFYVSDNTSYLATVVTLNALVLVAVLGMQISISSYVQATSLAFIGRTACSCQTLSKDSQPIGERCMCTIRTDLARRFSGMVSAWCLCWIPVTVVAVMVCSGHSVPAQTSVPMLLLLLPLCPTASPVLYGMGVMKERRRHTMQDRLLKRVGRKIQ